MTESDIKRDHAAESPTGRSFRILSLDGGGAKGFYTLGVLREIEGMLGCPLHERFDLIYGTSTGAIIGALLALGCNVDSIYTLYKEYVPVVMRQKKASEKSHALHELAIQVFGDKRFGEFKTNVGIVATRWVVETPMIFKGNIAQAHGRAGTFIPGFGCTIGDAVEASCSAYPFFDRKLVHTDAGDDIELIDGGYCANNPTLYAIADAVVAMKAPADRLRVISVGVGSYPQPSPPLLSKMWFIRRYVKSVQLLQKTLDINTQSMNQLRIVLFNHVPTIRISDSFEKPEMATDLFEQDFHKLNILRQRGSESFAKHEPQLKSFLG